MYSAGMPARRAGGRPAYGSTKPVAEGPLAWWAAAFPASDEARWITGATLPESRVLSVTPLQMALYPRSVPEPE